MKKIIYPHRGVAWTVVASIALFILSYGAVQVYAIQLELNAQGANVAFLELVQD